MTPKATSQERSRNLPGAKPRSGNKPRSSDRPRIDKARETQHVIIEDASETEDRDRDLVHGDGGTIDLPSKPGDLSKDERRNLPDARRVYSRWKERSFDESHCPGC